MRFPPFILVRDDATVAEIDRAIGALRDKQRRAVIASTRDEIDVEINRLFEMRAMGARS